MLLRILAVLFLLSMPAFAQSTIQGNEVNELTPDNIGKNTLALTPEMQQKFIQQAQKMTPEQRQAIMNQAKTAWDKMPQAKKDAIKQKATEQYHALTPEQKQVMQKQAMEKWESMSQQEKQLLGNQFQDLLQGQLQ